MRYRLSLSCTVRSDLVFEMCFECEGSTYDVQKKNLFDADY
jgi:hypothetical protein